MENTVIAIYQRFTFMAIFDNRPFYG